MWDKDCSKQTQKTHHNVSGELRLTVHCPKCRTVIDENTQLCTGCGAIIADVPSVDRLLSFPQPASNGTANADAAQNPQGPK